MTRDITILDYLPGQELRAAQLHLQGCRDAGKDCSDALEAFWAAGGNDPPPGTYKISRALTRPASNGKMEG